MRLWRVRGRKSCAVAEAWRGESVDRSQPPPGVEETHDPEEHGGDDLPETDLSEAPSAQPEPAQAEPAAEPGEADAAAHKAETPTPSEEYKVVRTAASARRRPRSLSGPVARLVARCRLAVGQRASPSRLR